MSTLLYHQRSSSLQPLFALGAALSQKEPSLEVSHCLDLLEFLFIYEGQTHGISIRERPCPNAELREFFGETYHVIEWRNPYESYSYEVSLGVVSPLSLVYPDPKAGQWMPVLCGLSGNRLFGPEAVPLKNRGIEFVEHILAKIYDRLQSFGCDYSHSEALAIVQELVRMPMVSFGRSDYALSDGTLLLPPEALEGKTYGFRMAWDPSLLSLPQKEPPAWEMRKRVQLLPGTLVANPYVTLDEVMEDRLVEIPPVANDDFRLLRCGDRCFLLPFHSYLLRFVDLESLRFSAQEEGADIVVTLRVGRSDMARRRYSPGQVTMQPGFHVAFFPLQRHSEGNPPFESLLEFAPGLSVSRDDQYEDVLRHKGGGAIIPRYHYVDHYADLRAPKDELTLLIDLAGERPRVVVFPDSSKEYEFDYELQRRTFGCTLPYFDRKEGQGECVVTPDALRIEKELMPLQGHCLAQKDPYGNYSLWYALERLGLQLRAHCLSVHGRLPEEITLRSCFPGHAIDFKSSILYYLRTKDDPEIRFRYICPPLLVKGYCDRWYPREYHVRENETCYFFATMWLAFVSMAEPGNEKLSLIADVPPLGYLWGLPREDAPTSPFLDSLLEDYRAYCQQSHGEPLVRFEELAPVQQVEWLLGNNAVSHFHDFLAGHEEFRRRVLLYFVTLNQYLLAIGLGQGKRPVTCILDGSLWLFFNLLGASSTNMLFSLGKGAGIRYQPPSDDERLDPIPPMPLYDSFYREENPDPMEVARRVLDNLQDYTSARLIKDYLALSTTPFTASYIVSPQSLDYHRASGFPRVDPCFLPMADFFILREPPYSAPASAPASSPAPAAPEACRLFISYKREDIDTVRRIAEEIEQRTGVRPWMDLTGIESGTRLTSSFAPSTSAIRCSS